MAADNAAMKSRGIMKYIYDILCNRNPYHLSFGVLSYELQLSHINCKELHLENIDDIFTNFASISRNDILKIDCYLHF